MNNVIRIPFTDNRCGDLFQKVYDIVYEGTEGMSVASVIGVLEMVKLQFAKQEMKLDD